MTAEATLGRGKPGGATNLETLYKDLVAYTRCFVTFTQGGVLDSNTVSYLNTIDCNSIGGSTLGKVRYRHERYDPKTLGPNTGHHVELLSETAGEYDRLKWAQTRLLLGGEQGLAVEDPGKPIRLDETSTYVLSAERQGIIINQVRPIPQVEIGQDWAGILMSLQPHGFYFGREALVDRHNQVVRDERFRDQVLAAGIHKLGCLLAVTDQLIFEERVKGNPVDPNYTTWVNGEDVLYMAMFNEPKLPGIHSLYQRTHSLLLASADPHDPLLQHLFPLTTLPNFK